MIDAREEPYRKSLFMAAELTPHISTFKTFKEVDDAQRWVNSHAFQYENEGLLVSADGTPVVYRYIVWAPLVMPATTWTQLVARFNGTVWFLALGSFEGDNAKAVAPYVPVGLTPAMQGVA